MSGTYDRAGQSGLDGGENTTGLDVIRAAIRSSLVNMLTIGTGPRLSFGLTPAGLAHSVGVSLLEIDIMARGSKKAAETNSQGMPKFVDVKLTQEQKAAFVAREQPPAAWCVDRMQQLVFSGYRFGCSWSGEHQSFTVSMTCRNDESANNGLCMTSFAGQLLTAVRLALYKHYEVCDQVWTIPGADPGEDFG